MGIEVVPVGPGGARMGWVTLTLKRSPTDARLLSRGSDAVTDEGHDVHRLTVTHPGRYVITVGARGMAPTDVVVDVPEGEFVRRVVELAAGDDGN